ncbi:unnamed protein product [Spirodela intermedia]|uniref:Uncharacterized protein n=2 Tax=Spirodela intermedia TaxID=51605 RepID=A0A7I8KWD3_SPIIN|nr:unnamed protein product [Spirodela intermedia]CAA6665378.1 unnamed protein product [Spirodela intermedia]CAA6674171.1 unnamed protein product [Spirodela intermedia]CAA7402109.1 unnamed protein product [Spirodela intermedia]
MAANCSPVCHYQPSFRYRGSKRAIALSPPPIHGLSFTPRRNSLPRLCRGRTLSNLQAHSSSRENTLAVISGESSELSSPSIRLTYLEGNSWLWDVGGVNILVDPILVGNLDFGIPWLYDGEKKFLKNFQLEDLPELDCLLITQSLDDHCHVKTLKPLSELRPDIRVVATPNAESILNLMFKNYAWRSYDICLARFSHELLGINGAKLSIQATAGPVLGPPWQRPENGFIVVMKNGDLETKGILSKLVRPEGTLESFKELLSREVPDARVLEPTPENLRANLVSSRYSKTAPYAHQIRVKYLMCHPRVT